MRSKERVSRADIVILGGGVSGLAAASRCQEARADYLLLERRPAVGGLTRTVQVGDFSFDYTGHFLHLRRYASPGEIPLANLQDRDWVRIQRRSCCYVAERMVTAPIQYHLGELPADVLELCIKSYNERPSSAESAGSNLREYLVGSFGQALADLFLIPQNEKTLAISLNRLCLSAVKRFFPVGDEDAIRRGMKGEAPRVEGYNDCFWYPKTGGIEALIHGFARGVEQAVLNQGVCRIDLPRRRLWTADGWEIAWDALLTSVALPAFCRMTGEPDLVRAAEQLTHSATISVNLGIRDQVATPLRGLHWVYVPEASLPFYRVGVYSNISDGVCSRGYAALYAEVGLQAAELDRVDLAALQSSVIEGLERIGWLNRDTVECLVVHLLPCAYVHHTPSAVRLVEQIVERLIHANVYPIGRYGRWDYTSMEDSIYDGLWTAGQVLR